MCMHKRFLFLKRFDVVDFALAAAGRSELLKELYLTFLVEEKKIRKAKLLLKLMKINTFNLTTIEKRESV